MMRINHMIKLGEVYKTRGVDELIPDYDSVGSLIRHKNGDWGNREDVGEHDWQVNDEAVKCGSRILSVYKYKDIKYWIITEADRKTTTILLPSEY